MRLRTKIYKLIVKHRREIEKLSPDFMYRLEKLYFFEVNRLNRLFVYKDPSENKRMATDYFKEELGYALNKLGDEINLIYRFQILLRCFCKQVYISQISIVNIETIRVGIKNKLRIYKELVR